MEARNNWNNKKVFVTGGTGFIGKHLVNKLLFLGANVGLYIHNKESHASPIKHHGDLREDSFGLSRFLQAFQPEVVFHLAAQPIVRDEVIDETETILTNVNGTLNVIRACKGLMNLKSFVHISTDKVFGNLNVISRTSMPHGTGHPYNASKAAGEQIAQMYSNYFGIPMVVVRNANVYGEGDTHLGRIIPGTICRVLSEKNPIIRGDGTNTRDYLHVSDVVSGYIKAADLPYKNKLTTLNLGGFNYTTFQVVDAILEKMRRVDLHPIFEEQWAGEIPHQHIERDTEGFDWEPKVDLDNGLDKTIPWYTETYGN